jgi:penicillin-binding protein 2
VGQYPLLFYSSAFHFSIMSVAANPRTFILRGIFIATGLVLAVRLLALQLFEDKYKVMANDIAIYRKVVYPPRGIITDRKGEVMCYNEVIYDLMMTASEVPKDIDSVQLCRILGIDLSTYHDLHEKAKWANGPKRPGPFIAQLTKEQTARFQENLYAFPGFQLVERNIRSYKRPSAGVMMGFIGEVSPRMLKSARFASYQQGDYVGLDGLELKYEEVLRGQRGVYFYERDNYNRPRDRYLRGALDTPAVAGKPLQLYVDAALQEYGERLMVNKLGSVVAIDPATGGILAMVSSPGYDPNLLRGATRSRNFANLYKQATKPLFNRAMKAFYNPGSTQKPLTALIALDVGAITPAYGYPCGGGYNQCGRHIACTHSGGGHAANLRLALAHSCNAYFCHIYRMSVDAEKFGGVKKGLENWYHHMYTFGFGHPTGVDLPYEIGGTLYDTVAYNKLYNGVWNSCTNVFIGMGQGELAATPLQMANALCIIANHGFYYIPHLVKSVGGNHNDPSLAPYLKKNVVTHISDDAFTTVGLGMQDVVDKGTGKVAQLPGIEVCAKTGTVENYALINGVRTKMQNHSMFVAFAPREHPKIAIAVTVENSGYGATWAGPIASLMIEKYLTDSIAAKRKPLEERMLKGNVISKYVYIIDSNQRAKWALREQRKLMEAKMKRAQDSLLLNWWIQTYLLNPKKNNNNS